MYDANSMKLTREIRTQYGATLDAVLLDDYQCMVSVGVDRCLSFWYVIDGGGVLSVPVPAVVLFVLVPAAYFLLVLVPALTYCWCWFQLLTYCSCVSCPVPQGLGHVPAATAGSLQDHANGCALRAALRSVRAHCAKTAL